MAIGEIGEPDFIGDMDEEFGETDRFSSLEGGEDAWGMLSQDQHNVPMNVAISTYFSGCGIAVPTFSCGATPAFDNA